MREFECDACGGKEKVVEFLSDARLDLCFVDPVPAPEPPVPAPEPPVPALEPPVPASESHEITLNDSLYKKNHMEALLMYTECDRGLVAEKQFDNVAKNLQKNTFYKLNAQHCRKYNKKLLTNLMHPYPYDNRFPVILKFRKGMVSKILAGRASDEKVQRFLE